MRTKKTAVLGAGTMGPGIALTYALGGYDTALYSRSEQTLARAKAVVRSGFALFVREGLISQNQADTAMAQISYTTDLEAAVDSVFYVAETIVEREDAKAALYARLDKILPPEVIIASNTSYMDIFSLMSPARRPYTVIAHFYAPAHILPLVEIVKGPDTLDTVMEAVVSFHKACGKTPVRMEKYTPGFIVNRLQSALTREVMYLVENGYCTAEDLDLAVKTSLMPRGLLLGLVQRMDFTGLDMMANSLKNKKYIPAPEPDRPKMIFDRVAQGNLGVKTGKGLYDYSDRPYEEVLNQRDEMLLRSVALARAFMETPLENKENTQWN